MRRGARLVIAVLGLVAVGCGRGFGCVPGEKVVDGLDASVAVAVVRKVRWTNGKVPGPDTDFYLRMATTPPTEYLLPCDDVDLAEDDPGTLVGWRCRTAVRRGDRTWTVLRLRAGGHALAECSAPVGTDDAPAFERLEPLARAAARIVDCLAVTHDDAETAWRQLAGALLEDEGAIAAADLFVANAARAHLAASGREPWWTALLGAPDDVRRDVRARLCPALVRADAPMQEYARAADLCGADAATASAASASAASADGVTDAALAQLARLLVRPVPVPASPIRREPPVGDAGPRDTEGKIDPVDPLRSSHARALLWAATLALTRAPVRAGAVACRAAPAIVRGSEDGRDEPRPRRIAATVIAMAGAPCEATRAWFEAPPCGGVVLRGGTLVSRDEVRASIASWLRAAPSADDAAAPPERRDLPENATVLLGLAYTFGAPGPEITVRNARLAYPFEDARTDARPCADPTVEDGARCRCEEHTDPAICATPAAVTTLDVGACRLRIDDAARRLTDARRRRDPPAR